MTPPIAENTFGADEPMAEAVHRRLSDRGRLFIALIAIPLAIGFISGWMGAGRTSTWPLPASLAYWIITATVAWQLSFAGTWALARSATIRRLPIWALLALGNLLASPLLYPFAFGLIVAFQSQWIPVELHRPLPELSWRSILDQRIPGLVLWVGLQLFVAKGLGWDVFRLQRERSATNAMAASPLDASPVSSRLAASNKKLAGEACNVDPGFFARVPHKLGRDLIAIVAEQHYLRVVTRLGSCLVLYRMSDAVRELEAAGWPGLQVHRSWWVARNAVSSYLRRDSTTWLVLEGGLRAPVSRSFREDARRAGLIDPR